jgi:hypothetical protein
VLLGSSLELGCELLIPSFALLCFGDNSSTGALVGCNAFGVGALVRSSVN